ncbi:GNAT family N-acetyltransferase [Herbaspirillum sp. RV1423]|uniref:GNAT family N-acetyltransferase n=1 Tax=Herbaspirillum sp. RV1423 TaxID=1443993 RepID=UPI0009E03BDE|nr:GNAT family protein [Herbaspirillum sp. RV1423]
MTTSTMCFTENQFGQPVGVPLPDWTPRRLPPPTAMYGRYCGVEPITPAHADQLFDANNDDVEGRNFTYLFVDKPASLEEYREWVTKMSVSKDPMMHAIVNLDTGAAVGVASFMRIDPNFGVIEVGNINFSPRLQRTRAATEAMFLMMRRAFDELGYRRYEWKCDSLNAPSRAAAQRYGFTFEGIFRKAVVYKNRSRDTAWFSIVDSEWPQVKSAFEHWLDPENFDAQGRQRESLATLMARHRTAGKTAG